MKTTKFFVMMAAIAVMYSCGPHNDPVTVTLDKTSITVKVGGSEKLNATVTPKGNTVVWGVEDDNIAMVTNGTVVGKAVGNTKVYATCGDVKAECTVTVTLGGDSNIYDKFLCLQGSDYYPWVLSEGAISYLESKGKTVTWIGANGSGEKDESGLLVNSQNLWYWDNSIITGTPEGKNSFDEFEGYLCIQRNIQTWGGGGFAIAPPTDFPAVQPINLSAIYANPEKYFLHVALKVTDPSFAVTLGFGDGVQNGKKEVKFTFGNVNGDGNQTPYAAIPQDGMWHEFEIPCTKFVVGDQMMYQKPFYDANTMFFLLYPNGEGTPNVTLHLDAAFLYKK